jgi:hypothetical protein
VVVRLYKFALTNITNLPEMWRIHNGGHARGESKTSLIVLCYSVRIVAENSIQAVFSNSALASFKSQVSKPSVNQS